MAISSTTIKLVGFPPTLPNIPPNYPTKPTPGKIELLLNSNTNYLYHKFSPYTNYHDSVFASILSDKQPFIYTYIDKKGVLNQLPQSVQSLGDIVGINQDSVDDVVRVSKFLISSWGIQFLITQAAIQRLAPFDETRIYNPLSPVLSTVYPLTLGLGQRPVRHIEGGFLGLANSVTSTVGVNLQSGFITPSSTTGDGALPPSNTGQGKGLIRGSDAAKGISSLQSKWSPSTQTGGALSNFASSIGNAFKSFFGSSPKSPGTYRADEQTADLMYNAKTTYNLRDGSQVLISWFHPWYNGDVKISKERFWPRAQLVYLNTINPRYQIQNLSDKTSNLTINSTTRGPLKVGYDIQTNTGVSYWDYIYPALDDQFTNSDMLINYADYAKVENKYVTKLSDDSTIGVTEIKNKLQSLIDNINNQPTYKVFTNNWSYLLPYGSDTRYVGYDNWSSRKAASDIGKGTIGKIGAGEEYNAAASGPTSDDTTIPKTIDVYGSKTTNLRMATTFMSDGINQLGIVGGSKKFNTGEERRFFALGESYKGWTEYRPYDDDLIAFFFYDVVNDKYIPFRATVKGINEAGTANWDPLRFIGRADQLYSYNGFSRTLSFTFNIVINSVTELLPSWKKINYIASAIKPSNYTTGQRVGESFNRFIVPPMFMLTIGDLYKFQPIILTSVQVMIPDDAAWETLNENNSPDGWSYLNGLITAKDLGKNYGQLPREIQISITCDLLEKERAIVGGSNFGHQPRIDDWENVNPFDVFVTGSVPYLPIPTVLHKGFVEWNNPGTPGVEKARTSVEQDVQNTPFILTTPVNSPAPSIPSSNASFPVPISNVNVNNVANSPSGYTITKQGTTFKGT